MNVTYKDKQIKNLAKIADKIIELERAIEILSNEQLKEKTLYFKKLLKSGKSLDDILIEAFAVAREASFRALGKKHYKVQLIGAIALHQGRVAQMKTGEGKTLTELCPAYLNALEEKGVHIITVNDYLAQRDKEEMEPFFNFLGMSVGLVTEKMGLKKQEYACDVTYATNVELGFDYLRDNIVLELGEKVQRGFNYVIIDEIDSVLIDEARTPLIIAGEGETPSDIYMIASKVVKSLNQDDYELDKKENTIILTDSGIKKIEKIFGIENLSDIEHIEINHVIAQSLRACYMQKINKDYIVVNGEVILIDANTGRIAEGRRYSDGLHQAIEAKENLEIKPENRTIATITYQNFFKMYKKVAGMSGTVKTEETEFKEIYELDVVEIPTNKEIKRIDKEDLVYINNEEKLEGIVNDIIETTKNGNPILVGTPSIEKSEELSKILFRKGIRHKLLNAKTNQEEAQIIACAGELYAITVATNIAGRGTDIKISDEVNEIGGLKVIGTERTLSRRIDNQLIGRAGRQGDTGISQFYLSCDDELLKVYGDGTLKRNFEKAYKKKKIVSKKSIVKAIEKAQKSINSIYYEARKYTLKYDFTVNKQRELIYKDRNDVLGEKNIAQNISDMILQEIYLKIKQLYIKNESVVDAKITINNVSKYGLNDLSIDEKNKFREEVYTEIENLFLNKYKFSIEEKNKINKLESIADITNEITLCMIEYLNNLLRDKSILNDNIIRKAMLVAVDTCWINHLDEMEILKKVVKDQSYNQKDPVDIYKLKGAEKFEILNNNIRSKFIYNLFLNVGKSN